MFHCSFLPAFKSQRRTDIYRRYSRGASQFHRESVDDCSLKASCPFKSFISITQQVQWHTSNKQPEKESSQGWVEAARGRNQTPTDRQALWSEPSLWLPRKHTRTHSLAHNQPQQTNETGFAWSVWSLIRTRKCRGDFVLPPIVKIKVDILRLMLGLPVLVFNQFKD